MACWQQGPAGAVITTMLTPRTASLIFQHRACLCARPPACLTAHCAHLPGSLQVFAKHHLVLETSQVMADIPYGDHFRWGRQAGQAGSSVASTAVNWQIICCSSHCFNRDSRGQANILAERLPVCSVGVDLLVCACPV